MCAIKQRQELIDASKAYRFSHADNKFSIHMEDGKSVEDGRALQVSIDNHGHIVAKETDAQGGTHTTEAAIGKDGKLHQIKSEDVDQYGNKTIDQYDPKTGLLKEEIKEDLLSKTDTKYARSGNAESQDTYNKLTGEKSHIDFRRNPEHVPSIPWPEVPQSPPSIPLPEIPQLPPDGKSQFIDGKAPVHELPSDKNVTPNERGLDSMVRPHPADKEFNEKEGLWHDKKTHEVVPPPQPETYGLAAVEEYTKSIMTRPDRAQSFVNRGAAYVNTGELDKALKDENHAIQLLTDKKDSSLLGCAYFNRSVIEDKRNHKVKALKDAEEARKLDHTNADAQKYVLEHRQLRKNGKIVQDRVPLE